MTSSANTPSEGSLYVVWCNKSLTKYSTLTRFLLALAFPAAVVEVESEGDRAVRNFPRAANRAREFIYFKIHRLQFYLHKNTAGKKRNHPDKVISHAWSSPKKCFKRSKKSEDGGRKERSIDQTKIPLFSLSPFLPVFLHSYFSLSS